VDHGWIPEITARGCRSARAGLGLVCELLHRFSMQPDLIETDDGFLVRARGADHRNLMLERIGRVIDYLFGLLYSLLLVRLGLEFFGARSGAGFVKIIDDLTDVFYGPFKGIFPTTSVDAAHVVWPLVAAIVGYMLLHAAIRGLLRLFARA
jgi:hypothetical protein